jgi:hypothetical protein
MGRPRSKHNDIYDALQKEYLKSRDCEILEKMYAVSRKVAYNYIRKYCEKRRLHFTDINDKAHDSATYVISQYLKHPDFKIGKISAYTYFGIKKALFENKDVEMNEISYDEYTEKITGTHEEVYL